MARINYNNGVYYVGEVYEGIVSGVQKWGFYTQESGDNFSR